jgi:DNA-binding transcriptional regulator YiaG
MRLASTPKATPEEVKIARFSPRLFRSLRKHWGITQKELAILTRVTLGAVNSSESRRFRPKQEKKAVIVVLRKMGRQEVTTHLEEKGIR